MGERDVVLYVDDEARNLSVFEAAFEDEFEVHTAASAREALEILEANDVDLLITDQRMPQTTGVELLEAVSGRYPTMARIVLTAYSDIQAIIQAINTGRIDQYVTKPYNPANLAIVMKRELKLKRVVRHNQQLQSELEEAARRAQSLRELFQKYVPDPVVQSLMVDPGSSALMLGEDRVVTVLFAAINDFGKISRKHEPEEIVGFLNNYVGEMYRVVIRHQGLFCGVVGDELLIVFGAPISAADNDANAVEAAVQMVAAMRALNERSSRPLFGRDLTLRVGVHRGEVISGNVGSARKMEYGVVGDTVNTASRIRDVADATRSDIVISSAVKRWLVDESRGCEDLGEVVLRGIDEPIGLHRVKVS